MDCLFCKIIEGSIPSKKVYEDEDFYAFHDIKPAARIHILVVPKKHLDTANDLTEENINHYGKILLTGAKIAKEVGIDQSGYRLVFNCNREAGMEISHLHLHIIGGEQLGRMA